ncbi:gamma-glutamyl-gamma-aminobutyrate hydrolase family protein [Veronia pacifica]|uniref:gamma-glutamyl-gamma-aminobutyrate hydrolase family protein n=1 Tax=Veronia pacifica TaxID=1080227 RepID=UPI001FE13CDD|nr:gamma-glutamyl-gamma-aminobutyrate hydrolase family protein [Veronia pacifica]
MTANNNIEQQWTGKPGDALTSRDRDIPLVGVVACNKKMGLHNFHIAGEKYLRAVTEGAGCLPLVLPSFSDPEILAACVRNLDGLLFTGSPSNIEPHHYSRLPSATPEDHDAKRDAFALPLIRLALEANIPLLAICRGFQEMNVALGGSLHQQLHQTGRFIEHRENKQSDVNIQYGLSHSVAIEPGGILEQACGSEVREVNSVHAQGIDRLGKHLRVEARAPDGLIEAISVDSEGFALGVQWHPEWKVTNNPFYSAIFKLFGDACWHRISMRERDYEQTEKMA